MDNAPLKTIRSKVCLDSQMGAPKEPHALPEGPAPFFSPSPVLADVVSENDDDAPGAAWDRSKPARATRTPTKSAPSPSQTPIRGTKRPRERCTRRALHSLCEERQSEAPNSGRCRALHRASS